MASIFPFNRSILFLLRNFFIIFFINIDFFLMFVSLLILLIIVLFIFEFFKKCSSSLWWGVIIEFSASFIDMDLIASASITLNFFIFFIVFLQNFFDSLFNPIPLPISRTSNFSI